MSEPRFHQVRIRFLSDWRIGSGPGSGAAIVRDADGLPCVPAKTLLGVWRESCEQLCLALDRHRPDGPWSRWSSALFGAAGRNGERAIALRSARYPEPLRSHLRAASQPPASSLDPVVIRRNLVKIDEATGAATESTSRRVEFARAGGRLDAEWRLNDDGWDEERSQTAEALLVASAALARRIGGHRRRGAGRCRLELVNAMPLNEAVARLKQVVAAGEPPTLPSIASKVQIPDAVSIASPQSAPDHGESGKEWVRVPLRITARSPLVVSGQTAGSTTRSADHVSGASLLRWATSALSALGADLGPAIARGEVRVLPAVPESSRGIDRQLLSHRARNGTAFAYDAIRAGTVLTSELRLRKDLADRIAAKGGWTQALAPRAIALGRSKNDDYGDAWIEALVPAPEPVPLIPAPSSGRIHRLTVTLQTDVLPRDRFLRPSPTIDALRLELGRRLGLKTELRTAPPRPDQPRVAVETRRLESWSAAWGLPRPSLIGLKSGGVVEFESDEPIDPKRLAEVEADGVGERRGEGYGLLRFQGPTAQAEASPAAESSSASGSASVAAPPLIDPSQTDLYEFARSIENACWRASGGDLARVPAMTTDGHERLRAESQAQPQSASAVAEAASPQEVR